jgi:hypothetical protein
MAVRVLAPVVPGDHEQVAVVVALTDPQPLMVVPLSSKLTVPGVLTVAVTVTGVPKAAVVALEGRATEVVVAARMFPLSVEDAGIASIDVAVAKLLNEPIVADTFTLIVIGGNVAPRVRVDAVRVHDTADPLIEQVQPLPVARVGVSEAGKVSVTVTAESSFNVLVADTPAVRVTDEALPAASVPDPLSVFVSERIGDTTRADA